MKLETQEDITAEFIIDDDDPVSSFKIKSITNIIITLK